MAAAMAAPQVSLAGLDNATFSRVMSRLRPRSHAKIPQPARSGLFGEKFSNAFWCARFARLTQSGSGVNG